MLEIALKIIFCLLLAALIGGIIGYLICRVGCSDEKSCDDESDTQSVEELLGEDLGTAPLQLDAPRDGVKDNLTRIKGIGVKIEESLNSKGIFHFDQIASWGADEIVWVDHNIAFPGRVVREEWVKQAELLASGAQTEFSKRVDAGEVSSSKRG